MTNAQIIFNEAVELMKNGKIHAKNSGSYKRIRRGVWLH